MKDEEQLRVLRVMIEARAKDLDKEYMGTHGRPALLAYGQYLAHVSILETMDALEVQDEG